MAEPIITPINPTPGSLNEAIAGSQAVIFTAADRKVIEERGGDFQGKGTFLDALAKKPLTPEVENAQTTDKPEQNLKEIEARYRDHKRRIKHATLYTSREHVDITGVTPDTVGSVDQPVMAETIALAKELKLDPAELFDKFALEQQELFSLISRIKELHLQRLLSESQREFAALSRRINQETLRAAKPEAKAWLEAQMNKLTLESANYKLKLLRSLQSLNFDAKHQASIKWLDQVIRKLPADGAAGG